MEMNRTYQSEYGLLKSIILKRPKEAFINEALLSTQWKQLSYLAKPNLSVADSEYEAFVKAISNTCGVIHFIDLDEKSSLDSIYVRDASITTDKGVIICNMGKQARLPEPQAQKKFFEQNGIPILGAVSAPGTIEGGDVVWIDQNTLAIGRGYRTNDEGIRQIKEFLYGLAEVVEVHLPHYKGPTDVFHLMSTFSPVDQDLAAVYSPLMSVPFREQKS